MNNIKKSKVSKTNPLELLISLPFLWVFSGQLTTSGSYKYMVILSIISIIISCWFYGYKTILNNISSNKWIQIIGIMLISTIFYKEYNGSSSNGTLRAYAVMFVFLVSLPRTLSYKLFNQLHWYLLLSSVFMLIYTMLNMYYWNIPRALWNINPIPYTTISAAVAISSICHILLSSTKETRIVSLIALILSFNALVTGLSRGPFLALLVSFSIVLVFIYSKKTLKYTRLLMVIIVFLFSLVANSSLVTDRIKSTENAITTTKNGGTDTSIGVRLQLWKSSVYLIFENPILGLGNKEQLHREQLASKGIIEKEVVQWEHYHNQYIDTLIKQGIVGFILLLLLLFYPLTLIKELNILPTSIVLGVLSIFGVASLTDIPISHTQPLIMFIALISLSLMQKGRL